MIYPMQQASATLGNPLLTINNPDPQDLDYFGLSVATTPAGDLLVGAYLDDTGADDAGSVYLFDGTTGDLLLTLKGNTCETFLDFGSSVASTSNGNIIVGAIGSVYLLDGITGNIFLTINPPSASHGAILSYVASTPTGNIIVGATEDNTGAENKHEIERIAHARQGKQSPMCPAEQEHSQQQRVA